MDNSDPISNPYRSVCYTVNRVAIRWLLTEERIDPLATCKYCSIPTEAGIDSSIYWNRCKSMRCKPRSDPLATR